MRNDDVNTCLKVGNIGLDILMSFYILLIIAIVIFA